MSRRPPPQSLSPKAKIVLSTLLDTRKMALRAMKEKTFFNKAPTVTSCVLASIKPLRVPQNHDWREPEETEAREEGAFCRQCGRPASLSEEPCIPC